MGYRFRRVLLPLIVVLYVVVAKTSEKEIFPFFEWTLFTTVPEQSERIHVTFTQLDGKPADGLDLVKDRARLERFGVTVPYSMYSVRLLNILGQCLERAPESPWCQATKREFEETFLPGVSSAAYDVIRKRYDPVVFLQTGRTYETKKLASLSFVRGIE